MKIEEYKKKLQQIEKILKESDEMKEDPQKREEIEKLRD